MSDASAEVHVRETKHSIGAHQPIPLHDPELFYLVRQGHLDVFAAEFKDGAAHNRTPFVTRVPAGEAALGAGFLKSRSDPSYTVGLLAVPSQDTVVTERFRADCGFGDSFDISVVNWIDDWVFRLSEFLVRRRSPVPRGALLVEADPDVRYAAQSTLSAHHSDIIWICADQPMRLLGLEELVLKAGKLYPLSERLWVDLGTDTMVSAMHTPTALFTNQLWPAVDRFHRLALAYSVISWAERLGAQQERYRIALSARFRAEQRATRDLGRVLDAREVHTQSDSDWLSPFHAAADAVAESVGVELISPREMGQPVGDPAEALADLVRASGIWTRKISLVPGWWRRSGPSFVGSAVADGRPIALLSDGRGTYRAVDPTTKKEFLVREREASRIAPGAVVLYAPLLSAVTDALTAFLDALHGHARNIWVVIAMSLLGAVLSLTTPIVTGKLLGEIIPRVDLPMWTAVLGALFLAAIGTAMFEIVRALAMLRIEGRVDERLQAAVWGRLLSLPVSFFRDYSAGDLSDRINGISQIRQVLTGATATATIGGVFSIFSFALLFYYSWELALAAGAVVLILIVASWAFGRRQMIHYRNAFRLQGAIDGYVFQLINGLAKLRIANAETYALARWAERFARQKAETMSARWWAAGQIAFNSMFTPLATLTLFAYIWYGIVEGQKQSEFTLADFLSFSAAFGQFAAAMTGLTAALTSAVVALPLFERVEPILKAQPESVDGTVALKDVTGEFEFSGVTFRYLSQGANALNDVSFYVKPGEYVAFVGESGSGKSTIFRMLLGFERPDSGAVFIDGQDISSLDATSLRRNVGTVLQNSHVVATSIFKNITSGLPMTMEEAWAAAEAAGLAEDIRAMPMGMHTVLPEGGKGMSGGQRQRLLIARALARKPRALLLDEATSALDNQTQAVVQASVKRLSITRIVIAHRLSTVQDADRIYVLDGGRIVESGPYPELMARDGAFSELARRQVA